MYTDINKISREQSLLLAEQYHQNPEMKYIVYNIRRRTYILHTPYQYYFRFSRRESVWNTPVINIQKCVPADYSVGEIAKVIFNEVNQIAEDTVAFKLKRDFTLEDCTRLLHYYFNGKCYLAYYDYHLGRVCLIKERDKSEEFSNLIGTRYYFIDDLHNVIQYKLDLDTSFLKDFLRQVMKSYTPIPEIEGFDHLNKRLHHYILEEIQKIDTYIQLKSETSQ